MRTLAEYFGFRPTQFLPNGCGAGFTSKLVPDEIAGVELDDCCDLHDLAYHVGRGGILGLFYAKPQSDFALMRCLSDRLWARYDSYSNSPEAGYLREGRLLLAAMFMPAIYITLLTVFGWTPLTWPWKERPMPSHEDLERLLAHNKED